MRPPDRRKMFKVVVESKHQKSVTGPHDITGARPIYQLYLPTATVEKLTGPCRESDVAGQLLTTAGNHIREAEKRKEEA